MKREYVVIGFILVVITIYLTFWGTHKEGFFLDELYTYGYTCQFTMKNLIVGEEPSEFVNKWYESSYFLDNYVVSDEEAFDYPSALKRMQISCHPPVYYLIFFTIASITKSFSKWIGIVPNIVFTLISVFFVYKITKKLSGNLSLSLMISLFWGLNVSTVSGALFLRMYSLLTMETLLYVLINVHIFDDLDRLQNDAKHLVKVLILLPIVMIGSLTHYFFIVYAFFFTALMCVYMMVKKHIKLALEYGVVELIGVVLSALIYPGMLQDFLGSRGTKTRIELLSATTDIESNVKQYYKIIDSNLFSDFLTVLVITAIGLFIVLLVRDIHFFMNRERFSLLDSLLWVVMLSSVFDFLFVAKCTQYRTIRYIQNICPLIYISVFIILFDVISKLSKAINAKAVLLIALSLLTIMSYRTSEVQNLYEGTSEKIRIANSYSEYPVIYIFDTESGSELKYSYTLDSVYFLNGQRVFAAKGVPDKESIASNMDERYVVYVSNSYSDVEVRNTIDEMKSVVGCSKDTLLYETTRSFAYLIE